MRKIEIVPGVSITDIALGAGGRGDPLKDPTQALIMDRYLELGGNCFDTARMYAGGECDRSLGAYFKSRGNRDQVALCTKGSHPLDPSAMHLSRLTKEEIERDLDESLAAIGTDHSELHLLHRDNPKLPVEPIVEALDALVKAGKTRAVGVSNWSVARIQEANEYAAKAGLTKLSVCQLHYSLLDTTAPATGDVTHVPMNPIEFEWYRRERFPVMCFGSQGRGYFARRAAGLEQKPGGQRYYGYLPWNAERADRLTGLAERIGAPIGAVAAAFPRDSGLVASALVGCSSVAQLEEVMAADGFRLTAEEVAYLEG